MNTISTKKESQKTTAGSPDVVASDRPHTCCNQTKKGKLTLLIILVTYKFRM